MLDSSDFRNKVNYSLAILIVILIAIIFFRWNRNNNEKLDLIELYEQRLQNEIQYKEQEINSYKSQIEKSKKVIQQLESKQIQYEHSLDSLDAIRNKTIIVYRDKIIKAKSFQSDEVLDYWIKKF
mgnify:FL=1